MKITDENAEVKNPLTNAAVLSSVYALISSFVWGIIGFRGVVEYNMSSFFIDILAIAFIVNMYSEAKEGKKVADILAGTFLFLTPVILIKIFLLYPLMGKIFE